MLLFGALNAHSSQDSVFPLASTFVQLLSMGYNSSVSVNSLSLLSRVQHLGVEFNVGIRLVSTRTEYITLTLLRQVSRSRFLGVSLSSPRLIGFLHVSLSNRLVLSDSRGSVFAHFASEVRKFVGLPSGTTFFFIITTDVEAITVAERLLMVTLSQLLLNFILLNLFQILNQVLAMVFEQNNVLVFLVLDVINAKVVRILKLPPGVLLSQFNEGVLNEMGFEFRLSSLHSDVNFFLSGVEAVIGRCFLDSSVLSFLFHSS